jgi:hypothetical protein
MHPQVTYPSDAEIVALWATDATNRYLGEDGKHRQSPDPF